METTKRYLVGALLVAAGAALLAIPLGSAIGQLSLGGSGSTGTDASSGTQVVPGSAVPGPPEPTLTDAQRTQATKLLSADSSVQGFAGNGYTVQDIAPWSIDHPNSFEILGAAVTVQLAQPTSYPMESWPLMTPEPAADPPFDPLNLHMAVSNATELQVDVDLQTDQVISIVPDGPNMTSIPGADMLQAQKAAAAATTK